MAARCCCPSRGVLSGYKRCRIGPGAGTHPTFPDTTRHSPDPPPKAIGATRALRGLSFRGRADKMDLVEKRPVFGIVESEHAVVARIAAYQQHAVMGPRETAQVPSEIALPLHRAVCVVTS